MWELLGSGIQGDMEWHLLLVFASNAAQQGLQSMARSHPPWGAATLFTT